MRTCPYTHLSAQPAGSRCRGQPWFTHLAGEEKSWGSSVGCQWSGPRFLGADHCLLRPIPSTPGAILSLLGLDPTCSQTPQSLGIRLGLLGPRRDAPAPSPQPFPLCGAPSQAQNCYWCLQSPPNTHTGPHLDTERWGARGGCRNRARCGDQRSQAGGPPGCVPVTPEGPGPEVWPKAAKDILRLHASAAPRPPQNCLLDTQTQGLAAPWRPEGELPLVGQPPPPALPVVGALGEGRGRVGLCGGGDWGRPTLHLGPWTPRLSSHQHHNTEPPTHANTCKVFGRGSGHGDSGALSKCRTATA